MEQPSRAVQEAAWRSSFQRMYLSRLVAALRRRRIEPATCVTAGCRAVKSAADLSLAMMSRGRTAWSRAIIGRYLLRPNKSHCRRRAVKSRGNSRGKRRPASAKTRPCKPKGAYKNLASTGNEEAEGIVASRLQTLRALVPGSRGLDTPVFLREAADYIVALKMQVQAMHALAHEYSNSIADSACQV